MIVPTRPGGQGGTAIIRLKTWRMAWALGLACLVHMILAGLIMGEVLQTPAQHSDLIVDLRPLHVNRVTRKGGDLVVTASPGPTIKVSGGRTPAADRIGREAHQADDLLRVIRQRVMELWEPARPPGPGQALIVLDLGSNLQVHDAYVVRVTGTREFVRFMHAFARRLKGLEVSGVDHPGGLRVECEFRVEE